ncbi:hypothetical protein [Peribacillus frigoritolerans]|uniref:DUF3899 domain-containing protein n=1 Tax=Peribacillus castrilensis TaxID=2897690 RepID=A0AAW9NC74_9BACI|nr:hypothetical protein [Peribacillus castrilensis]
MNKKVFLIIISTFLFFLLFVIVNFFVEIIFGPNKFSELASYLMVLFNAIIIICCSYAWRKYHVNSVVREQEQNERHTQTPEVLEYITPFNHKKSRREIAIMYICTIFAGIVSIYVQLRGI